MSFLFSPILGNLIITRYRCSIGSAGINNISQSLSSTRTSLLLNSKKIVQRMASTLGDSPAAIAVRDKIVSALAPIYIEVLDQSGGCGTAFDVTVVSDRFEKLSLVQRHRLVYNAMGESMSSIHAFTQKTYTPSQWTQLQK
jgi:stress-induced morphogen